MRSLVHKLKTKTKFDLLLHTSLMKSKENTPINLNETNQKVKVAVNKKYESQKALVKWLLPPHVRTKWMVRSWIQEPVIHDLKEEMNFSTGLGDSSEHRI